MKRTTNAKARDFVQNLKPFKGSNTFAFWTDDRYIVYSYGEHWPLFIYEYGKWYENADKFSRSTSKQHSQLHPLCETEKRCSDSMITIAEGGVVGLMRHKLSDVS